MRKLEICKLIVVVFITIISGGLAEADCLPDTLGDNEIEYTYAFQEAIKQFDFGNYSQSLFLFKKCLEANNKSAASYYQVSNIYTLAGDSRNAVNYAREAYLIDDSNKWYALQLIKCYQMIDKNDSAIVVMGKLLNQDKDNSDLKYEYGSLLASVGRYKEAIECFNEIDKKIGINEGTSLARQQIYVQQHNIPYASRELEDLIKTFPGDIKYLGMLAELYSSSHETEKAKAVYKKMFQLDSTNSLALISITDFYRDIKEYDNSFKQMDKVIDEKSIQLDSKMGLLIAYIKNDSDLLANETRVRGEIAKLSGLYPTEIKMDKLLVDFFIRTQDYDSAIVVIEKFISTEESPDIWEQYYLLLNSRNKYSRIVKQFPEAVKYAGKIPGIYIIDGIANIQLLNYSDAVDALSQGLKLNGLKKDEISEFLQYKAEALNKLKMYVPSDSCFEELLKMEPENYLVLNNYSFYLAIRDTALNKAKKMSYIVVRKYPTNAVYLDTYAYVLFKMHRYASAYKWMKKAIDNNISQDADIYEHMGDILFNRNRREEAISFWNKAKEKGKSSIIIDDKIKSFEK